MYLERAKELFLQLKPYPPKGCTEEQMQVLEQELGTRLPGALREFLLWIGQIGDGEPCATMN